MTDKLYLKTEHLKLVYFFLGNGKEITSQTLLDALCKPFFTET